MIVEPLPRGLTRRRYQSGCQSLVCLLKPLNGAGSVITFSSDTALATSDRHSLFTSIPSAASAPLQRVQAQIRHKRCPLRVNTLQHLENQLCCPWPSASLVAIGRSGKFAALVMLLRLDCRSRTVRHSPAPAGRRQIPFTNHFSPLTAALAA
jgi:hypothetical protein